MKIKTSELMGRALNWSFAFAQAAGVTDGRIILTRDLANTAIRNGASPPDELAEG